MINKKAGSFIEKCRLFFTKPDQSGSELRRCLKRNSPRTISLGAPKRRSDSFISNKMNVVLCDHFFKK